MATSRAKLDGNRRHMAAKLDQMTIRPHKAEGARIRAAAAAAGSPLQRYILEAVRARMERERPAAPDAQPNE